MENKLVTRIRSRQKTKNLEVEYVGGEGRISTRASSRLIRNPAVYINSGNTESRGKGVCTSAETSSKTRLSGEQ